MISNFKIWGTQKDIPARKHMWSTRHSQNVHVMNRMTSFEHCCHTQFHKLDKQKQKRYGFEIQALGDYQKDFPTMKYMWSTRK